MIDLLVCADKLVAVRDGGRDYAKDEFALLVGVVRIAVLHGYLIDVPEDEGVE